MNLDKTTDAIVDVRYALDWLARNEKSKLGPSHQIVHMKVIKSIVKIKCNWECIVMADISLVTRWDSFF